MAGDVTNLVGLRPRLGHMDLSAKERSIKVTITRTLSRDPVQRRAEIESIQRIFNDGLASLLARLDQ
jgi:hypothetical protein